MTSTSIAPVAGTVDPAAQQHRLTFARLVRSEWVKFWSLRSLRRTTAAAVLSSLGLGIGACVVAVAVADGPDGADPSDGGFGIFLSLAGTGLTTLIVAAVGAMMIAGEYATGAIRTTLAVAPRRVQVYAAKAVVLAGVVTGVVGSAVLGAFFIGQAILAGIAIDASLGDPGVLRLLAGNLAVVTGVSLVGLGLGALLRNTAGAVFALIALMFVVPLLMAPLPTFPGSSILDGYTLSATTDTLTSPVVGALSVAASAVTFAGWVSVLLVAGALAMRRRDA